MDQNLNKRKEMFFKEHNKNMNKLIDSLIDFRIDLKDEDKKDIQSFFSSIRVTSYMLGYHDLSKLGEEYCNYIDSMENISGNSHEFFSKILEGAGIIKKYMKQLETEASKEDKDQEYNEDNIDNESIIDSNVVKDKGNILLLDDDRFISAILKDSFQKEGYHMMTTTDHEEAIEQILYGDIHIALIDVVMPKMNGFEVFEILKENNVNIPIIFLSGKSLIHYKVDALTRGVDDYITKPFEIKEVIARVERSLGRSKQYKKKLNKDKLTGLYNKEYFNEYISDIIEKKKQLKNNYAVAFMDLDDFKYINDNYGHVIGDYVLKDFASFLTNNLDQEDIVFRFGGDEFIILFINKDLKQSYRDVEEIRIKLNETKFKYKDVKEDIILNVSTGITTIEEKDDNSEDVLKRADKYLYLSKELNKNTTVCSNTLLD